MIQSALWLKRKSQVQHPKEYLAKQVLHLQEKSVRRVHGMKLKNILIVVKDIEKSRKYYHDLFGLELVTDNDGNLIEVGTPV